jgi:hypothetical protein
MCRLGTEAEKHEKLFGERLAVQNDTCKCLRAESFYQFITIAMRPGPEKILSCFWPLGAWARKEDVAHLDS